MHPHPLSSSLAVTFLLIFSFALVGQTRKSHIFLDKDGLPFDTGLRKFGALVGDGAEVGCNAVLNPGSVLGRGSMVYPNVSWRGVLPAHMIAKNMSPHNVVMMRPRETD